MEFLMIVLMASIYFFIGGVSYSIIQSVYRPKCEYAGTRQCDSDCGHSLAAGISVAAWPLIAPIMLGLNVGLLLNRTERRRRFELAEAEHRTRLAECERKEAEELERQLRSIYAGDDPGRYTRQSPSRSTRRGLRRS